MESNPYFLYFRWAFLQSQAFAHSGQSRREFFDFSALQATLVANNSVRIIHSIITGVVNILCPFNYSISSLAPSKWSK